MGIPKSYTPNGYIGAQVLNEVLVTGPILQVEECSHDLPKRHKVFKWTMCDVCFADFLDMMKGWMSCR